MLQEPFDFYMHVLSYDWFSFCLRKIICLGDDYLILL